MSLVFISYAREDLAIAKKLFKDLSRAGYAVWLDKESLVAGQSWKAEIANAIRNSFAFVALISKTSVAKQGYVQRELRHAFDVLSQMPANKIYVVPIRLDPVVPEFDELRELSWIDLFEGYEPALKALKRSLQVASGSQPVTQKKRAAPVDNASRDFEKSLRRELAKLAPNADGADPKEFYITFLTASKGVVLPEGIRKAYPSEITIVLQHQYQNLKLSPTKLTVDVSFNDQYTTIAVPYRAISLLTGPGVVLRRGAQ